MNEVYNSDKSQLKRYISLTVNKILILLSCFLAVSYICCMGICLAMFPEELLLLCCIITGMFVFCFIFILPFYFLARFCQKKNFMELQLIFTDSRIVQQGKWYRTSIWYSDIKKSVKKDDYYIVKCKWGRRYLLPVCCFENKSQIETRIVTVTEKAGTYEKTDGQNKAIKIVWIAAGAGVLIGIVINTLMLILIGD